MPDPQEGRWRGWLHARPVLRGVLPVERSRVPADMLAGLTLAALGIPEVLGYAKIAGMPRALPHARPADVAVSAGVIVIVVAARRINRRIPGLLIAVIVAIISAALGAGAYYATPGEALEAFHAAISQ